MVRRKAEGSAPGRTKTTKSRNACMVKGRGTIGGLSRSSQGASAGEQCAVMMVHASTTSDYRVVGASGGRGRTSPLAAAAASSADWEESPARASHRSIPQEIARRIQDAGRGPRDLVACRLARHRNVDPRVCFCWHEHCGTILLEPGHPLRRECYRSCPDCQESSE